jgi:hypothetical membrane protein
VKRIPWWAVLSALAAPLFLIGGWTLAAGRQPTGYDPIRDTISSLAAQGAVDRWIMTWALAGLGLSYLAVSLGLRLVRRSGRFVLAMGGIATVFVAVFPQPVEGNSIGHTAAATVAFAALALWPLFSADDAPHVPLLSRRASILASSGMVLLVIWFLLEAHGTQRGLAERLAAGADSIWPLAVVLSTRRALVVR